MELSQQPSTELYRVGHYPVDMQHVFRRTTDPVSPASKAKLALPPNSKL